MLEHATRSGRGSFSRRVVRQRCHSCELHRASAVTSSCVRSLSHTERSRWVGPTSVRDRSRRAGLHRRSVGVGSRGVRLAESHAEWWRHRRFDRRGRRDRRGGHEWRYRWDQRRHRRRVGAGRRDRKRRRHRRRGGSGRRGRRRWHRRRRRRRASDRLRVQPGHRDDADPRVVRSRLRDHGGQRSLAIEGARARLHHRVVEPEQRLLERADRIAVRARLDVTGPRRAHRAQLGAGLLHDAAAVGGSGHRRDQHAEVEVSGPEAHRPDDRDPRPEQHALPDAAGGRRDDRDPARARRRARRRRDAVPQLRLRGAKVRGAELRRLQRRRPAPDHRRTTPPWRRTSRRTSRRSSRASTFRNVDVNVDVNVNGVAAFAPLRTRPLLPPPA